MGVGAGLVGQLRGCAGSMTGKPLLALVASLVVFARAWREPSSDLDAPLTRLGAEGWML